MSMSLMVAAGLMFLSCKKGKIGGLSAEVRGVNINMKLLLSLLLSMLSILTYAQSNEITKTDIIGGCIQVWNKYDLDMNLKSREFVFYANNDAYDYISDTFIIKSGSAQDILNVFDHMIAFSDKYNENGIKINYGDYSLSMNIVMSTKYISLEVGNKWKMWMRADLKFIRKNLIKYCKKNKVPLAEN